MNLILTTCATTVVWLAVTFLTRPEPRETLQTFWNKTRPAGPGWKGFATESIRGEIPRNFLLWVLGITMVYSMMFATGAFLFGQTTKLVLFGAALLVSGFLLFRITRSEFRGGAGPFPRRGEGG